MRTLRSGSQGASCSTTSRRPVGSACIWVSVPSFASSVARSSSQALHRGPRQRRHLDPRPSGAGRIEPVVEPVPEGDAVVDREDVPVLVVNGYIFPFPMLDNYLTLYQQTQDVGYSG